MESRAYAIAPILVGSAVFAFLAVGVTNSDIAAPLVNAVDGIHAQDESVYAYAAQHVAKDGNWLTPMFLDRYYLFKPLLEYVLAGASVKLLGWSVFALRLPSLLAASALAAILFAWLRGLRGISAVLLLISNSLWYTLARLGYSDILLLAFSAAALYSLSRDPQLQRSASFWSFAAFDAAAILTKSLAGLIPLFMLALFAFVSPERPAVKRIVQVMLAVALLAAPWHVYQIIAHQKWFWTEYVYDQVFQFGMHPPVERGSDPVWLFYIRRIFLTDPFLCVAALIALPVLIRKTIERNAAALLAGCWLLVATVIVCTYQWRNFPYAVMVIVPLAVVAASYGPRWQMPILAAVLILKLAAATPVWSLHYAYSRPLAAAPPLRNYAARHRPNELILIDTDDEFYSATLNLPKVRYCFLDPSGVVLRYAPFFGELGITMTADQFEHLNPEQFRERLREWGLDSVKPVATSITARTPEEIQHLIDTHPQIDFYAPASYAGGGNHNVIRLSANRALLLATIQ